MSKVVPSIDSVSGFRVTGVHAGLKKNNALDFALIRSRVDCVTAGVFTTNKVKAAPVLLDMEHIKANPQKIRAVVINTVSANACTGWKGMDNARTTAKQVAESLDIDPKQVLVMCLFLIGAGITVQKIKDAGVKPLLLGVLLWVGISTSSLTYILFFM